LRWLVICSALQRSSRYRPDVSLFSSLAAYLDTLEWCIQQSRMMLEVSLLISRTPARRGRAGSRSGDLRPSHSHVFHKIVPYCEFALPHSNGGYWVHALAAAWNLTWETTACELGKIITPLCGAGWGTTDSTRFGCLEWTICWSAARNVSPPRSTGDCAD